MQTGKIVTAICKRPQNITEVLKFFTMWSMCIHKFSDSMFDKKTLAKIVSICGFYFTYISPKALYVEMHEKRYTIQGTELQVLDFITHHLPYIVEILKDRKYTKKSTMRTLGILGIYILCNDYKKIYKLHQKDVTKLVLLCICAIKL